MVTDFNTATIALSLNYTLQISLTTAYTNYSVFNSCFRGNGFWQWRFFSLCAHCTDLSLLVTDSLTILSVLQLPNSQAGGHFTSTSLVFSQTDFQLTKLKSKSKFMTAGLPPVSSSWRQAPWESQPEIFFFNWTLAVIPSSLMRRWVCLLWICLAFH
jgi:hypothetical protein